MNVTNTFNINFKGNIIDSHVHVGTFNGNVYTKDNLDIFVKSNLPNKDNVEKMIVSDLDVLCGLNNEFDGNKTVLNIFKNDKKFHRRELNPGRKRERLACYQLHHNGLRI